MLATLNTQIFGRCIQSQSTEEQKILRTRVPTLRIIPRLASEPPHNLATRYSVHRRVVALLQVRSPTCRLASPQVHAARPSFNPQSIVLPFLPAFPPFLHFPYPVSISPLMRVTSPERDSARRRRVVEARRTRTDDDAIFRQTNFFACLAANAVGTWEWETGNSAEKERDGWLDVMGWDVVLPHVVGLDVDAFPLPSIMHNTCAVCVTMRRQGIGNARPASYPAANIAVVYLRKANRQGKGKVKESPSPPRLIFVGPWTEGGK